MQKITGGDEVDMMDGTIDLANEDLRNIIRGAFQNQQQQRQLEREALDDGTSTRLKTKKSPSFNVRAVENDAEEIKTSLTMTEEEKERELNTFFSGFENYYETNPEVKQQIQQLRLKYLSTDPYREAQLRRGQMMRSD